MFAKLQEKSLYCPSIALHNGQWHLAWTGLDRRLNIGVFSPVDGDLKSKHTLQETSFNSPAICSHAGQLFIAWCGIGNKISIGKYVSSTMSDTVVTSETSDAPLALVSDTTKLFVAWKGMYPHSRLNIATFDGMQLTNKCVSIMSSLIAGPSLAFHAGEIYAAWPNSNSKLHVAKFKNGQLAEDRTLSDTSTETPCLASIDNSLYLTWIGVDNQRQFNIAKFEGQLTNKQTFKPLYTEEVPIYVPFKGQKPTLHHFGPHNLFIKRTGNNGMRYAGGYFVYNVHYDIPEEPANLALSKVSKEKYDELVYHNNLLYVYKAQ